MLKKIVLISFLALQCAYASQSVNDLCCNYRLLDKRKESYAGRIIELIPIRSEKIVEDLDFLYPDQDKNFKSKNFTQDDFTKLCKDEENYEKSIINLESQSTDSSHFFSEDCINIFCQLDSIKQQAIYVLLEGVNNELEKYLASESALKTPPLSKSNINSSFMKDKNTPEKRKRSISPISMLLNKRAIIN
jgi:hypothetical protein